MFANLKIFHQLFIRILFLILTIGMLFYLVQKNFVYTSMLLAILALLLFIELYFNLKNAFLFYDKTINAILNRDFSADFSKNKSKGDYLKLFELYATLKTTHNEHISKDLIYKSILNKVETGILILQKNEDTWDVFLMNDFFSKHFEVPKVSKWKYLKNQMPALCGIIEEQNFSEIKTFLQIRVNEKETQTFVMQSARTKIYEQEYYVVLLDSIQKVIEKKEKEAWVNLMKVISHELLNSLTPIRSLSQNLKEIVNQETLSSEDLQDIKESVETMYNRSNHLQEFVESYRKLAMLPSPQKEKVELSVLVENCLQIMKPLFKKEGVLVTNNINFKRWILVDSNQMEQVFINLLTNSLFALAEKKSKEILINAESKDKRMYLTIADNGTGIEPEIETKILLPFFTTRKDGAGIGLTLSKNIIEAHGGYLSFKSDKKTTQFTVCLLE
jgi:nitrogen fixation/metabolism regulation signal transduction histidine kinase